MPLFRFTLQSDAHATDLGSLDLASHRGLVGIGLRLVAQILARIAMDDRDDRQMVIRATDEAGTTLYRFHVLPPDSAPDMPSTAMH